MAEERIKQTSGVPKGLLQLLVLKLLADKALAGAEIVEKIEDETSGFWKPSPGSIYPLLAKLHDKGYTNESRIENNGMKRYILTDEGKTFFEKQVKFGQKFLKKLEYLSPIFIGGFQTNINHENLNIVGESAKKLVKMFINTRTTIKNNLTKQDAEKIAEILNDCTKQLEKITEESKMNNLPYIL